MTQVQPEDHQRVKFDTLIEALDHRTICPLCSNELTLGASSSLRQVVTDRRGHCLVLRNTSNTADFLRVRKDGKTVELLSDIALHGKNGVFHYPLFMQCNFCYSYTQSFRLDINMAITPNKLDQVLISRIALTINKEDQISLTTYYLQLASSLKIGEKEYPIDFIDIVDCKKLITRFDNIIPFI